MKLWAADHPKAKLIARKRAAILAAARQAFLRDGYDGVSMEGIAAAAGVSIMTLYRHAESKDQLFAAVMLSACEFAHDQDDAVAFAPTDPLYEVLVAVGDQFQQNFVENDTVSLFRTVMVEVERFPHLAEAAYRGFIQSWEVRLDQFLEERAEFARVPEVQRRRHVATFIDDLVGADFLRVLLGLEGMAANSCRARTVAAVERLLANVPA